MKKSKGRKSSAAEAKSRRAKRVTDESELAPVTKKASSGDFDLNPKYYEELGQFEVFSTEKKIAKVFGVKDKAKGEPYVKLRSRTKMPWGWKFTTAVDLYDSLQISRLFRGIQLVAKKLGWKSTQVDDIEQLKKRLREREETIINLEQSSEEERREHEKLIEQFRTQQERIFKSRVAEFQTDVEQLEELIRKAEKKEISESILQVFLHERPWLFGTEYVNSEPQKMRGAHSKFDFYLERFNKTSDILEIKFLSDPIINRDGGISAKVVQAVDQLMVYMESVIAVAHGSVTSKEEGIYELRPRGVVIIGKDNSEEVTKKLHMWNYQFAHISILTYQDIVKKAHSLLKNIKNREGEIEQPL